MTDRDDSHHLDQLTGGEPPDLRALRKAWAEVLSECRQNALLSESRFIRFARDRGSGVRGTIDGDPSRFHGLGWLDVDGELPDGGLLFHPFRLYPLHRILRVASTRVAAPTTAERDALPGLLEVLKTLFPSTDRLTELSAAWNRTVDLAVLLEPAYWPGVVEQWTWNGRLPERAAMEARESYCERAKGLVQRLDEAEWRGAHEKVRQYAYEVDANDRLYLLLRLSPWSRRQRLKGAVSAALWFRHIAELLRRAFEDVHGVEWLEEDHAFGQWPSAARERLFGAERPLDSPLAARPYLAEEFGLFTGSTVRWYVEGETEYHAVKELLPGHHLGGIELVNLKGNVAQERDNIALKLSDNLREDRAFRRFSLISFDTDVRENTKAVARRIESGQVVGLVYAHDPDFEFANFDLEELVEVAARFDDDRGVSGKRVREGDWTGVDGGKAFEEKYCAVSARRPRQLKGPEWGRVLGEYAAEHPEFRSTGKTRPLCKAVEAAIRCRVVSYDFHLKRFRIDPRSFELVELEDPSPREGH